ncbi:hypothetical protein HIM_09435 [Hirsutella minnesotensis 3608]|uniref:Uncharacterized protein n=1 Tax=Hirsutella minnesotensis 3608 TaxID=1043627 RepID=A0A0F7ZLJ5_9HYPO|nr:hypothetical protein HIM_09435 [Hirsutella minnesotensis 3608]
MSAGPAASTPRCSRAGPVKASPSGKVPGGELFQKSYVKEFFLCTLHQARKRRMFEPCGHEDDDERTMLALAFVQAALKDRYPHHTWVFDGLLAVYCQLRRQYAVFLWMLLRGGGSKCPARPGVVRASPAQWRAFEREFGGRELWVRTRGLPDEFLYARVFAKLDLNQDWGLVCVPGEEDLLPWTAIPSSSPPASCQGHCAQTQGKRKQPADARATPSPQAKRVAVEASAQERSADLAQPSQSCPAAEAGPAAARLPMLPTSNGIVRALNALTESMRKSETDRETAATSTRITAAEELRRTVQNTGASLGLKGADLFTFTEAVSAPVRARIWHGCGDDMELKMCFLRKYCPDMKFPLTHTRSQEVQEGEARPEERGTGDEDKDQVDNPQGSQ